MTTGLTRLSVPPNPRAVPVLRVVAADAAAAADLGFDRYSDLELAISEASALLLAAHPATLSCTLVHEPGRVDVRMHSTRPTSEPVQLDELSKMVLDAVTDELAVGADGSDMSIEFQVGSTSSS